MKIYSPHLRLDAREPKRFESHDAACEAAELLQSGDPEWTYEVQMRVDGWYGIKVWDENGLFVANW
tara:strand:+ start:683 stop:880 length:198 start_codon:yes stop_codon:yes gene_type:complete